MFDRRDKGLWWDRAWSLVEGCTPVSPGCDHCWSAALAHRFCRTVSPAGAPTTFQTDDTGRFNGLIRCRPDRLDVPLKVQKPTAWAVWNDLFHEDVPLSFITQAWDRMACVTPACGQRHRHAEECYTGEPHIFLVLTKRPERMRQILEEIPNYAGTYWPGDWPLCTALEMGHWPLPNVWLGVTAENQEQADRRIPVLLEIPAAVRFVSVEPCLGPITLNYLHHDNIVEVDALNGTHGVLRPHGGKNAKLDWVIVGGESGPRARPLHPDWARSLRDQCQASGRPFFFKQWGEWALNPEATEIYSRGTGFQTVPPKSGMIRVGKKAAGRLLDGRTWDEVPSLT